MQPDIGVITNPNSKKNWNHGNRRASLERAVGSRGIVVETPDLQALPDAVDKLLAAGCKYWVCDGGDGTLHWIVNTGYHQLRKRNPQTAVTELELPTIVPTNGGTVDFVARKAGLRGNAESIIERLRAQLDRGQTPITVEVDTCRVHNPEGEVNFDRIGLAAAIGGVASKFFDHYYQLPKSRGAAEIAGVIGSAACGAIVGSLNPSLRRMFPRKLQEYAEDFFRPTHARVEVDGKAIGGQAYMSLQVGAIDINLAGVVRCFRHAKAGGSLHFQALSTTPLGVVANVPSLVLGAPIIGRHVFDDRALEVSIVATANDLLMPVIDGEQFDAQSRLSLSLGPRLKIPQLPRPSPN